MLQLLPLRQIGRRIGGKKEKIPFIASGGKSIYVVCGRHRRRIKAVNGVTDF